MTRSTHDAPRPRLSAAARAALMRLREGSQTAHQPPLALRELRSRSLLDVSRLTAEGEAAADQLIAERSAH